MIISSGGGGISPWHALTERARGQFFFMPLPLDQSSMVNPPWGRTGFNDLYGEDPPSSLRSGHKQGRGRGVRMQEKKWGTGG